MLSTLSSSRIRGFDGLRALAFLLVFVSHKAISPLTDRYGTAGVWIFFVLSGFLITRILAEARGKIEAGRGSFISGLSQFYGRRTARIFPVYYVFLAVVTMLALRDLVEVGDPAHQASNWFYLSNVYIELNGWQTQLGHLWSLAVEEQFYLLFAPLVLAAPLRQLPIACFSILAVSIAAHGYLFATGAWTVSFEVGSFVNFGLMAIGGLAGLWAERALPWGLKGDGPLAFTLAFILVMPVLFRSPESWGHFRAFDLRPQRAVTRADLPVAEWAHHSPSRPISDPRTRHHQLCRLSVSPCDQFIGNTSSFWLFHRDSPLVQHGAGPYRDDLIGFRVVANS